MRQKISVSSRRVLAYRSDLLSEGDVRAWMPRRMFIEAEVTPQVALLCREPVAATRDRPLTCSAVLLSTSPNARAGLPQFVCAPPLT
jgi:hypothetical protein